MFELLHRFLHDADGVFCPKLDLKRDVPTSPIIATGSTGAIGGHSVHRLHIERSSAKLRDDVGRAI
jgi:hypothetical protein